MKELNSGHPGMVIPVPCKVRKKELSKIPNIDKEIEEVSKYKNEKKTSTKHLYMELA